MLYFLSANVLTALQDPTRSLPDLLIFFLHGGKAVLGYNLSRQGKPISNKYIKELSWLIEA